MTAPLIFFCLFLLIALIGALGYVGVSSTVAILGLFVTILVQLLLFAGRWRDEMAPGSRQRN